MSKSLLLQSMLLLFISYQALASDDCSFVDLNQSTVLKDIPILDQDGIGVCYAYTAATLIEFELRKAGKKRTVSPIDIGLIYKQEYEYGNVTSLDAGGTFDAVKATLDRGVATRECIDRVLKAGTGNLPNMNTENLIKQMHRFYALKKQKKSQVQIRKEMIDGCNCTPEAQKGLLKLIDELHVPLDVFLSKLLKPCEDERLKTLGLDVKVSYRSIGSDYDIKRVIDKFLAKSKPSSLGICSQIIQGKPNYKGVYSTIRGLSKLFGEECEGHAVLVTARRKIENKCHYLVRNSWGATWQAKGRVCACKTKTKYYQDCKSIPANDSANKIVVGCWVDQAQLLPNTFNAGGLE